MTLSGELDPDRWHFYCRLCGTRGSAADEETRDIMAEVHLEECPHGGFTERSYVSAGRMLHVWSHPDLPAVD